MRRNDVPATPSQHRNHGSDLFETNLFHRGGLGHNRYTFSSQALGTRARAKRQFRSPTTT